MLITTQHRGADRRRAGPAADRRASDRRLPVHAGGVYSPCVLDPLGDRARRRRRCTTCRCCCRPASACASTRRRRRRARRSSCRRSSRRKGTEHGALATAAISRSRSASAATAAPRRRRRDAEHVRDELLQLLLTSPGERLFLPEFGGGVRKLVFEPASDVLRGVVKARITNGAVALARPPPDGRADRRDVGRRRRDAGGDGQVPARRQPRFARRQVPEERNGDA